jgi:hypothetical protein
MQCRKKISNKTEIFFRYCLVIELKEKRNDPRWVRSFFSIWRIVLKSEGDPEAGKDPARASPALS